METKLTLKLDKNIILKAKKYAKKRNISISKIVENYFENLTAEDNSIDEKITPLVKELSGVIDEAAIDNHKQDYSDYLTEKYK